MADAAARSFARDCNAAAATVVALSTAYGYGGDVGGGGTVAADGVGDDRRAALRTHKPTHRSAPVRKRLRREPSPSGSIALPRCCKC